MRKFQTGQLVITCGIDRRVKEDTDFAAFVCRSLADYIQGNWGQMCEEDKDANEEALRSGNRLMGVYSFSDGDKIWIITEWDRSATTILFPDEY